MISCTDIPSISGVYNKICDDPLEYTCGYGTNTIRLVKTQEWRLMYNIDQLSSKIRTLCSYELFGSRFWTHLDKKRDKKRLRVIPNFATVTNNKCFDEHNDLSDIVF
jgi:hypothetical protein